MTKKLKNCHNWMLWAETAQRVFRYGKSYWKITSTNELAALSGFTMPVVELLKKRSVFGLVIRQFSHVFRRKCT